MGDNSALPVPLQIVELQVGQNCKQDKKNEYGFQKHESWLSDQRVLCQKRDRHRIRKTPQTTTLLPSRRTCLPLSRQFHTQFYWLQYRGAGCKGTKPFQHEQSTQAVPPKTKKQTIAVCQEAELQCLPTRGKENQCWETQTDASQGNKSQSSAPVMCSTVSKGKTDRSLPLRRTPGFLQFISWGINLPKRMRRAAPSAAQWENCSSTKIWYAKGMQRAPASAGRNLKEHTGTLVLYSEIRENSCTHKYEAANCS